MDLRKVARVYELWKQRAAQWAQSSNEKFRQAAKEHYSGPAPKHPPLYSDFRKMLDESDSQIDAVVVATPDHAHAVISAAALRAGKPVFSEKPLTELHEVPAGFTSPERGVVRRLSAGTGRRVQQCAGFRGRAIPEPAFSGRGGSFPSVGNCHPVEDGAP